MISNTLGAIRYYTVCENVSIKGDEINKDKWYNRKVTLNFNTTNSNIRVSTKRTQQAIYLYHAQDAAAFVFGHTEMFCELQTFLKWILEI